VGEIGIGGARVASKLLRRVPRKGAVRDENGLAAIDTLVAFDISSEMLKKAKQALRDLARVRTGPPFPETSAAAAAAEDDAAMPSVDLHLLDSPDLPPSYTERFDVMYSVDVFPHLDLHVTFTYLTHIRRSLKPGGLCFLSFADLTSPGGWSRFARQKKYSVGGFYFMCREMVTTLVGRAGLQVVRINERADEAHTRGTSATTEAAECATAGRYEFAGGKNVYLMRDILVVVKRPCE